MSQGQAILTNQPAGVIFATQLHSSPSPATQQVRPSPASRHIAVGAGTASRVFRTARAMQAAETGAKSALGKLGEYIDALAPNMSGPIQRATLPAMESLSGYKSALASMQSATVAYGAAQTANATVSGTSLLFSTAVDNPYRKSW
jgi:hypothetical protein